MVAGGKTFFWSGVYSSNLNERETLVTDLNVFETFEPKLSRESQDADILFLANIQPDLQLAVREQCTKARFVAMDSMNLWIDIANESLKKVIGTVDCLILNDEELEQLTGKPTLQQAAHEILSWGPKAVVAKLGKYGAALFTARLDRTSELNSPSEQEQLFGQRSLAGVRMRDDRKGPSPGNFSFKIGHHTHLQTDLRRWIARDATSRVNPSLVI